MKLGFLALTTVIYISYTYTRLTNEHQALTVRVEWESSVKTQTSRPETDTPANLYNQWKLPIQSKETKVQRRSS